MNRFLILALLASMASAQAAPSSFSADGRLPSSVASEPNAPAETSNPSDHVSRLPELLPRPEGKATLIGGTITKIDRVRDGITVKVFGSGNARIIFDGRTHVYRDGVAASPSSLQNGQRVYVDTMLAGVNIFAKNIRVVTQGPAGESVGQVVRFNAQTGELVLRDQISPQNVGLRVSPTTVISRDGRTISTEQLLPGTLVSVTFQSGGGRSVAREISVLAAPGNAFVFVGRVVHLDLHLGLLVVVDPRGQKSYEISFDPGVISVSDNLREGATVEATTTFDGRHYMASAIKVESSPNR
ncbi:MAG: hypothetical protein WB952_01575 [Terriglobales bacterium]